MINIPGNPANYPVDVRAADGSDPRNAGTEQAGISDLADRTAYLLENMISGGASALRTHWKLTTAEMKTTEGREGDLVYDPGSGWFFWYANEGSYFTADDHWIIASEVQAPAVWVSTDYGRINSEGGYPSIGPSFNDSSVAIGKIRQNLQTNYLIDQNRLPTSGNINDFFEDGNERMVENSRWDLTVLAGDRILMNIGPLQITNQGASGSNIEVRYSVNGGSSWGVLGRYFIPPRTGAGVPYRGSLTIPISSYFMTTTATVQFCLYGMPGDIDSLIISTAEDYGNTLGTFTHFRH